MWDLERKKYIDHDTIDSKPCLLLLSSSVGSLAIKTDREIIRCKLGEVVEVLVDA